LTPLVLWKQRVADNTGDNVFDGEMELKDDAAEQVLTLALDLIVTLVEIGSVRFEE
jgi:hypothetical protein